MQQARGQNNAQSFFHIEQIPCDNQIRQMLDPITPETLFPVYDRIYDTLREHGILQSFRGVHDSTLLAMDGTWYHSSQKIHCPCCSTLEHKSGEITYYHSAVTPVLVAPGQSEVIALRPEFITPQDGHTKQDCEIAAAKRWLDQNAARYHSGNINILAFLFHTVLGLTDEHYRLIRATLPSRKTFFQHMSALTHYLRFPSWQALMRFMMRGLEIGPYAKPT